MRISIAGKVCFVLLIIFSSVLIAITGYQAHRERELVLQVAQTQAELFLKSYLDGAANLTTAADRETLRQQVAANPQLVSLQLFTADQAKEMGAASSVTIQSLMSQSSPKKQNYQLIEHGKDTGLVIYRAISPAWFTPCRDCLAANQTPHWVRLEYSLNAALDQIETHLLTSALLLCLFFGAGLLLALYIIRRQIVGPLHRISLAMERASDLGDHSIRLPVERNDELGRLSENFNQLMASLASSQEPHKPPRHPEP
jgi:methyl-accepting chemotaxis protein